MLKKIYSIISCKAYHGYMLNKQINEVKATDSTVYVSTKNHKGNAHQKDIRNNDSTCVSQATTSDSFVVTNPSNTTAPIASKDARRGNRGSSKRHSYSVEEKLELIEEVAEALDSSDGSIKTAIDYFRDVKRDSVRTTEKLSADYRRWSKKSVHKKLLEQCLGETKNDMKKYKSSKRMNIIRQSPFHEIEIVLYDRMVVKRKAGHKVTSLYLRTDALKILAELKESKPEIWESRGFKASTGWLRRFIKRKNIKFRKRKCGKKQTAEEQKPEFLKFLALLRSKIIPPREDDGVEARDLLWGRFPPHRQYNFDQVPLPFVINQDYTFTMGDDEHPHVKCPKDALRKRQFTMHVVTNAGTGDKAYGWTDLICKGQGKRISAAEKELWDDNIDVFWQKNAWVDTECMVKLANKFVEHKVSKHGRDVWVIAFCDNLSAHLDTEVKHILATQKCSFVTSPPI